MKNFGKLLSKGHAFAEEQSERLAATVANLGCIIAFVRAGVVKNLPRALWICCGRLEKWEDPWQGFDTADEEPIPIAINPVGFLYLAAAQISVSLS